MSKAFGYGEDALTLWALRYHISDVLKEFGDQTDSSECRIFYRPSFGRRGGEGRVEFGEFDAILVSLENVYLIESKWDNLSSFNRPGIAMRSEQKLRHRLFSWYLTHWDRKYSNDWKKFVKEQFDDFQKEFPRKKMAPTNSLLASNLQFVLNTLYEYLGKVLVEHNIKNLILFFYDRNRSKPPSKVPKDFTLVSIDYSQETKRNFVSLN